jgi:hypothetical protein
MAIHLTMFSPKCCCVPLVIFGRFDVRGAYSDFQSQLVAAVVRCQSIENGGELLSVELDVHNL